MISYASVLLGLPTPEQRGFINQYLDFAHLADLSRPAWPSRNLVDLPFAWLGRQTPHEINSLYWPVGAAKWAVGYYFATDLELASIRTAIQPASLSTTFVPAPLVIADGVSSVTTELYMLPPRPMVQNFATPPVPGSPLPTWLNGLWLITLVDDRYRWWLRSADLDPPTGSTQWADYFQNVATALNITLTTDAIPAAYLNPPVDLMSRYDYLPIVLDAMAASVGMRVVRQLNGSVYVQNATTAKAAWTTGVALAKVAGGQMLLDGTQVVNDVYEDLPKTIAVAFPITRNNFPQCPPYLSPVTVAFLAIPELSAVNTAGLIDTRYFHSSACAAYDTAGNHLNQTELDDLAEQLAYDWTLWQLAPLDVQFAGAIPWGPEGMHDVLWRHDSLPMFRVQRLPWNEWAQEVLHSGTYGSAFYAQIAAIVQVDSDVPVGSLYPGSINIFNATTETLSEQQPCWILDLGGGFPVVVSFANLTAQTGAVSSICAYTPATTGTFRVCGYVNITAISTDVLEMQVTYTDENAASQTLTLYPPGATVGTLGSTGDFPLAPATIRCNASPITVKTILSTSGGTVTYDTGAVIEQLN
jgi:hypothetical protein